MTLAPKGRVDLVGPTPPFSPVFRRNCSQVVPEFGAVLPWSLGSGSNRHSERPVWMWSLQRNVVTHHAVMAAWNSTVGQRPGPDTASPIFAYASTIATPV